MSAFTLRDASFDDIPAIARIYAEAVLHGTATYELSPPDEAEMSRRMGELRRQGYPYSVACDNAGAVIGYAYAGPFRARPAYRWTVEDSIYLAPEARGQGVGAALLQRLLDAAQALGFRQMIAVIGDAGNAPSIRVHAKHGFTHVGVFEGSGFKFGRWIDTVLMQRAVNGGKDTLPDEAAYPGTLV
ncbi:N-acetyltransferase family protein [Aureimonas flava]|uniref:N-acetyltransferase family protein n=1 Tax=Aureimonas flava TaxID=2320271 RepID=A0A3A1WLE1_9HYPH|nr:GNAT family N-acetyltransferase [Aureimonas flava]RIY01000.1 N-acetyltransferase family protein [Aureimonas flava]